MSLVLTVEDGSGVAGANTYISLADAELYFEANAHATVWDAATDAAKNAALVHATRILDNQVQWNGYKTDSGQPLQWPRQQVPDPDDAEGYSLDDATVPQWLKDAVCEEAQLLLAGARETDAQGAGVSEFSLDGVLSVKFSSSTATEPIPDFLTAILSKYGRVSMGAATVKLTRV